MRYLNILSVILFSIFAFYGCKRAGENNLRIGFVLDNMNEERYAKDKAFFEAKAKELGADVIFASAESDVAQQMTKVENMISSGVKALVIQPVDSNASASMVKAAKEAHVPVIAYDRIINNAPIDLYVTQDSFKVGVLQAEAAVKAMGKKGNVVILSGAQGHSVAEAITSGVKSVLSRYPDIKVVVHQYHPGWSSELALRTTENALTKQQNNVQAILANNSGMARGAVQAVAEQKLSGKIFIAGADADLASIRDITKDRQQFEVLKDIRPLAEAAAAAAVQLAQGKAIQSDGKISNGSSVEIAVINTPVYPVDRLNLDEVVIQSGFHSKQDVFGESAK